MTVTRDQVLELLDEVEALIQQGWCQKYLARTTTGAAVSPHSDLACQWCLRGAISRANYTEDEDVEDAAAHALRQLIDLPITRWNDEPHRTVDDVIALIRRVRQSPEVLP